MHGQVQQLRDAVQNVDELRILLENPEVDSRVKGDVLARIAQGADERVVNFVRLIAEKGRAAELAQIADELDALVAAEERILDVELVTAHQLSDASFDKVVVADRAGLGPQGAGIALGRPGFDRRPRSAGRIHAAGRERSRPARTTPPRTRNCKELRTTR